MTQAFDPSMTSSTGDLWSELNGLSERLFARRTWRRGRRPPSRSRVASTGTPGTHVAGTLYVDDYVTGHRVLRRPRVIGPTGRDSLQLHRHALTPK